MGVLAGAAAPLERLAGPPGHLLQGERVAVRVGDPRIADAAADVDQLADALFAHGIGEILAFGLPLERATMHLDTLMTFVDHDAVIAHSAAEGFLKPWRLHLREGRLTAEREPSMPAALSRLLDVDVRWLLNASGEPQAQREQWSDAHNTLAVEPGVVIGYDRNVRMNELLADAGVTVLPIPGGELGRGRGGPRCMSCPLDREA